MARLLILPALSLLAACAAVVPIPGPNPGPGPSPGPVAPGAPSVGGCDEGELNAAFAGQDASVLLATTFTAPVRLIRPGDAVTMDFNPERINFEIDASERVSRVYCG